MNAKGIGSNDSTSLSEYPKATLVNNIVQRLVNIYYAYQLIYTVSVMVINTSKIFKIKCD